MHVGVRILEKTGVTTRMVFSGIKMVRRNAYVYGRVFTKEKPFFLEESRMSMRAAR